MQNQSKLSLNKLSAKRILFKTALVGLISSMALSPALQASVKDGVDAWSRGEYDAAVSQWRPEALKGDADAQFNLGQAYKLGRGVDANLDTALDWYKQAADQGHLQAGDSYGHLLHYQGKVSESVPFLESSAARGEPRSQYLFATELFNGTNVGKDWVRAYALMTRASSAGLGPASRSLAQMDRFIPLSERQQGITLAGNLEQSERSIKAQQLAGFDLDTTPATAVAKPVTLPPSQIPAPVETSIASGAPGAPFLNNPITPPAQSTAVQSPPANLPVTAAVATSTSAAQPRPTQAAAVRTASGDYRIQLGAFGKQDGAKTLWNRLEGQLSELKSIQPYLIPTGNVTRLQAGPFASRSAADAMCGKIKATGQGCFSLQK